MSVLDHPKEPQTFAVDGIKFFKNHLDKLRYDSIVTDKPITTSEVAVFMLLHLHTDEMGQIRSLTQDTTISDRKQLCISNLASEHALTYETVKKAFDRLIARRYIAEVYTETSMHYEIVDYATYNQQINNDLITEKSSYFRIPRTLFQEHLFGSLIQHRYHKGAILLLELCQYFTVQLGTNRRYAEDIEHIKGERTMAYLKKTLNTTAHRVREFLSLIQNVFNFQPVSTRVKQQAHVYKNRRKSFTQVCIDKFSFSLNPVCFKRYDTKNERHAYARVKKEMAARMKHARIPVKWRDMRDIDKSLSRMVKISTHLDIVNQSKKMLTYTISKVADTLEDLHNKGTLHTIRRLGAFVNVCCTQAFDDFAKGLSEGERIKIMHGYHQTYGHYPPFLKSRHT